MRQKCDYCGSNPEVPVSGNCPNCGAAMPIFRFQNGYNSAVLAGILSPNEIRRIAGLDITGSFANVERVQVLYGAE